MSKKSVVFLFHGSLIDQHAHTHTNKHLGFAPIPEQKDGHRFGGGRAMSAETSG